MGRNKIKIEKISNERNRQVTFYKRKRGLMKKAMEISLLCEVKVMLCIVDKNDKVVLFSSEELGGFLHKYVKGPLENGNYLKTENYQKMFKKGKRGRKAEETEKPGEIKSSECIQEFPKIGLESIFPANSHALNGKPARNQSKKKSMFCKNEETKVKIEQVFDESQMSNSNSNFLGNIVTQLNKIKGEEEQKANQTNTSRSICPSPMRSIYSAPSINEKDSIMSLNLLASRSRGRTHGISTPDSYNSYIDTCGNTSFNELEAALNPQRGQAKPSCFKRSASLNSTDSVINGVLGTNNNANINDIYSNPFHFQNHNYNLSYPPYQNFPNLHPQNQSQTYNQNNFMNLNSVNSSPLPTIYPEMYYSQLPQMYLNQKRERETTPSNQEEFNYESYINLLKNRILNSMVQPNQTPSNQNVNMSNKTSQETKFNINNNQ